MSDSAAKPDARVRFVRSGGEVVWGGLSANLLEFAEEQDLSPAYGCRSGSCGACKVKLVEGEVFYPAEPEHQPEEGHLLLCCSQPKGDVSIDL